MEAPDEIAGWHERFDRAVERLPLNMRGGAHVTRCKEHDGTITFYDQAWKELATVDSLGRVEFPRSPGATDEKDGASRPSNSVEFTREHHSLLISLTKQIEMLGEALAELIPAFAERIKELESSAVHKALDAEAFDSMAEMIERLDRLETETKEIADNGFRYRGYWRDGARAMRGEAFTHDGSLWWAVRNTNERPGHASQGWQLAVRKGRDAK